jgi:hypothetical protein
MAKKRSTRAKAGGQVIVRHEAEKGVSQEDQSAEDDAEAVRHPEGGGEEATRSRTTGGAKRSSGTRSRKAPVEESGNRKTAAKKRPARAKTPAAE